MAAAAAAAAANAFSNRRLPAGWAKTRIGDVVDDRVKRVLASEYGFCRNYLYPWLKKFREGGWEALAERIPTPMPCIAELEHALPPGSRLLSECASANWSAYA